MWNNLKSGKGTQSGKGPQLGKERPHIISINTGTLPHSEPSKAIYSLGGKRNLTFSETNSMDYSSKEVVETEEKRLRRKSPLIPTDKNTPRGAEGGRRDSVDVDTLWRLNKVRDMLDDEWLIMESLLGDLGGAKNSGQNVEKKITVKALLEMLDVVVLYNNRGWVKSLRDHLETLKNRAMGEHLVPYKAKTAPSKNSGKTSQQSDFLP